MEQRHASKHKLPRRKTRPKGSGGEILRKEVDWHRAMSEVAGCIATDKVASSALATMTGLGCDQDRIFRKLYEYAGGSPEDAAAVKEAYRRRRDGVRKVAKRLEEVASEIEKAVGYLSDAQIDLVTQTPDDLRSLAEFFSRFGQTILKDLASGRVSSRDHHLVFLAKMFEQTTGKPHYRELAELANTVGRFYNPNYRHIDTAESMRKRIERYGLLDLGSKSELEVLRQKRRNEKSEK
jgi:hypothetical protein